MAKLEFDWNDFPEPEKSLHFIQHPRLWPNLQLPVKRRVEREHKVGYRMVTDSHLETGVMVDWLGPVIKKTNLWHLPETAAEFEALKGWTYKTFKALVDDGWRVD